jgi:protein O-GlcNAc transferase
VFQDIRKAFSMVRRQELREGLAAIDAILAKHPRMVDLWMLKAQALTSLGRIDPAIEAAKQGLRISPQSDPLALLVANLSLQAGRFDDASAHAELVLDSDPATGHDLLARIAMTRGDLVLAETEARKALAADPNRAMAHVTLARIEKERRNFEAALSHLDAALQTRDRSRGPIANLHFLRGDMMARLGRVEEAEKEFREEIRLFPDQPHAYRNLILLYTSAGRIDEATALVRELIAASPTPPSYIAVVETLRTLGDERGVRYWTAKGLERFPDDPSLRKLASR